MKRFDNAGSGAHGHISGRIKGVIGGSKKLWRGGSGHIPRRNDYTPVIEPADDFVPKPDSRHHVLLQRVAERPMGLPINDISGKSSKFALPATREACLQAGLLTIKDDNGNGQLLTLTEAGGKLLRALDRTRKTGTSKKEKACSACNKMSCNK